MPTFFPKVHWSLATHRKTHGKLSRVLPLPKVWPNIPWFSTCVMWERPPNYHISQEISKKKKNTKSKKSKNTDKLPYLTLPHLWSFDILTVFFRDFPWKFPWIGPPTDNLLTHHKGLPLLCFPHRSSTNQLRRPLQGEQRNCEGGFGLKGSNVKTFQVFNKIDSKMTHTHTHT